MKNLKALLMMAVAAVILLASCSERNEKLDKTLAYKIESKEDLTDADYTRMIKYVGEYAEKSQKYVDDLINGENLEEAQAGLDKLKGEFEYLNTFRDCIKTTPMDKFSAENVELLNKYKDYIEFSMPLSMSVQTDPVQAGVVVEDTNNVVAPVE